MCQNHAELIQKSRHRYERPLFTLAATLTLGVWLILFALSFAKADTVAFLQQNIIAEYRADHPETAELDDAAVLQKVPADDRERLDMVDRLNPLLVALIPLGFLLMIAYTIGKTYGKARADGVRITPEQFGEVHAEWVAMAEKLGLKTVPELYIQNGNGTLNAFATCMPGYRAFGVIYADILERALANDDRDALRFILGHELGHIRLKHVMWWYNLLTFIGNMPGIQYLIGQPLGRAHGYGCDKLGYALAADRDCKGLLMLAAGKHLYRQINIDAYEKEHIHGSQYWASVHNFFIDHPVINWRIAAIRQNRHGDLFWAKKVK